MAFAPVGQSPKVAERTPVAAAEEKPVSSSNALAAASGGGDELDSIKVEEGSGTGVKFDSKELAKDIGGSGGAPKTEDVVKKGLFNFGKTSSEGPKDDANGKALSTGASVAGAAGGITTAASILATGSVASAAAGPFFWVGLIVTVVAAGVAFIAGEISKGNKEVAADQEQNAADQVAKMNSMMAESGEGEVIDAAFTEKASDAMASSSGNQSAGSGATATLDAMQGSGGGSRSA